MRIGVIGVQGDVSEHVDAVARAMKDYGKEGEAIAVRRPADLGLMDMAVDRNAFGRQRESFEADLQVQGLDTPFHCVFIRAPAILRTWADCAPLSRYRDRIVLARQGHLIASAFHPELSGDLRIHRWFLDLF